MAAFASPETARDEVRRADRFRQAAMDGKPPEQFFGRLRRNAGALGPHTGESLHRSGLLDELPLAGAAPDVVEQRPTDRGEVRLSAGDDEDGHACLAMQCVKVHHVEAGDRDTLQQHRVELVAEAAARDELGHDPRRVHTIATDFPRQHAVTARSSADTWMLVGVIDPLAVPAPDEVLRFLRRAAPRARRIAELCTGGFVLAEAALLAGRRATTHWGFADAMQKRHPDVQVEPDRIYIISIWTSAGMTAGLDLALDMVEKDLGEHAARSVAHRLAMHQRGRADSPSTRRCSSWHPGLTASSKRWNRKQADLRVPST